VEAEHSQVMWFVSCSKGTFSMSTLLAYIPSPPTLVCTSLLSFFYSFPTLFVVCYSFLVRVQDLIEASDLSTTLDPHIHI